MGSTSITSAVLHSTNMHLAPARIASSSGNWLVTEDGIEMLDATGGAAVTSIGHGDERVRAAVIEQMKQVSYCYAPFFTTRATETLAAFLADSTGGKLPKVFVVSSGTEAVEAALKMARQYFLELPSPQHSRTRFIARDRSFHGNTLGSLAVGGHKGRRLMYEDILATNVSHVSPCYPYRDQLPDESDAAYEARLAQELDDEFVRVGPDTVCAFVAETISGSSLGCTPPLPGYFGAMKAVCKKHGALLILDEVMSGMGRTGTLHAWQQEQEAGDSVPDLQTVAKGLGAGYMPIGALLLGQKVCDVLARGSASFAHSQTYQGHPVAAAAAVAVQRVIREDGLLANVRDNGPRLGKLLREKLGGHANVGDIRGRGFFWGIELVKDRLTKEPFPPSEKLSATIHKTGLTKRFAVSLMPSSGNVDGAAGDMIILAPAFNSTEEELAEMVRRTALVIEHVLGQRRLGCQEPITLVM